MPSKWTIWDFFRNSTPIIKASKPGIYTVMSHDLFVERLLITNLKSKNEGITFHPTFGSEINGEWLEKTFMTFDLFSTNDSYYVLAPEKMSSKTLSYLTSGELKIDDAFLVFIFVGASPFYKKLASVAVESIELTAPKFWEGQKLFDFFCDEFSMNFSYKGKQLFLEMIENDSEHIVMNLKLLKTLLPLVKNYDEEHVSNILEKKRLDFFKLISFIPKKETNLFFESVLEMSSDFDLMRSLFSFCEQHFLKVYDPSFISKKSRPTKYDEGLIRDHHLMKTSEVKEWITLFENLEIMAKRKDYNLSNKIRNLYLKSLSV